MNFVDEIREGIPDTLPSLQTFDDSISRAPNRMLNLSLREKRLAVENALRYVPVHLHDILASEFAAELEKYGRIYMYRYRPKHAMYARPIDEYPSRSRDAAAIMHMIHNNLDPAVAQHPYELVTYGGNGTVFQNWAQYRLTMMYLSEMTDQQTLVIYSGHPLGLFPSDENAPRVIVTNGMVIPNYSSADDYTRMAALGVTSYGQMTAGSYMYIGPQGIVHGTTITVLNAGRLYLNTDEETGLGGRVFVTAGLGGMSGAQAKAAVIAGAICVVAEINPDAAHKRHAQGWVDELYTDLAALAGRLASARTGLEAVSLAYVGNIVDLLEYFVEHDINIDLGSDQTSLHLPFSGGYYPVGLSMTEANGLMVDDPNSFKDHVYSSLRRHVTAVNRLVDRGMHFWDYGNAFMLESSRAGADILSEDGQSFRYPSYVQDIMGPMCFDYGFGPFRWVCTSGDADDLEQTDLIATEIISELARQAPEETRSQYLDNLRWIEEAKKNALVVGSQARILYCDDVGRRALAQAFNDAIATGRVSAPIVLGRDHHDVSGTDSPYRETANIYDGSQFTADMAVQNFVGDAFRGATWVSLHNGGGVGWGEVINGGFGLVIDGSDLASKKLQSMLHWDVNNGIARRAWARNQGAEFAIKQAMANEARLKVTLAHHADPGILDGLFEK
ncbi:MAG: urocanate hydratase [Myxococcota bacterium]|nr:urocanate hydratase [Myxococcota bacterium]